MALRSFLALLLWQRGAPVAEPPSLCPGPISPALWNVREPTRAPPSFLLTGTPILLCVRASIWKVQWKPMQLFWEGLYSKDCSQLARLGKQGSTLLPFARQEDIEYRLHREWEAGRLRANIDAPALVLPPPPPSTPQPFPLLLVLFVSAQS